MAYKEPTSLEQGVIWVGCIIGSLSVINFSEFNRHQFFPLILNAFIYLFILHASFYILKKIAILEPFNHSFLQQKLFAGLLGGIFVGLIVMLINVSIPTVPPSSLWSKILTPIHGAFNEEVNNRLLLLPLILWLFIKIFKKVMHHGLKAVAFKEL